MMAQKVSQDLKGFASLILVGYHRLRTVAIETIENGAQSGTDVVIALIGIIHFMIGKIIVVVGVILHVDDAVSRRGLRGRGGWS